MTKLLEDFDAGAKKLQGQNSEWLGALSEDEKDLLITFGRIVETGVSTLL